MLGGSFDPVHNGHVATGRAALAAGYDEVVFLPVARSPHKLDAAPAPAADRFAMCVLATLAEPRFLVSRFELEGKEVSYSVDTARHFQAANPGVRFWWAVGADNLPKLHTWAKLESFFQCARFLVVPRSPLVGDALVHAIKSVKPWMRRWLDVLDMEPVEAASTDVREQIRRGKPWEDSVPPQVAQYISRYGLYQARPVWQTLYKM